VHDTIGIPEGDNWMSGIPFLKRFAKPPEAMQYVRTLMNDGNLHLLVFCMSGLRCRFQKAAQSKKYLKFRAAVGSNVPVVVVVTGLEDMGSARRRWWTTNAQFLRNFDGGDEYHACITTIPGTTEYDSSCRDVQSLISGHLGLR